MVVAGDAFDLGSRTQDDGDPLVQRLRPSIQDAFHARGGCAAGLFDDHGHGIGLVEQSKTPRSARIPEVLRIEKTPPD